MVAGGEPGDLEPAFAMKLAMTLLVRDEADVLEANLRFHFAQGVDVVVATDNGSTDGTLEILQHYQRAGLVHLIEEPADDYHRLQAHWITRMARVATTDLGADWVINNDADEFWWPVSGTLAEAFAAVPERYDALAAPRPEFVPRPDGPGTFAQRLTVRQARSHTSPKLAHRGLADVNVFIGSHRLTRGEGGPAPRPGARRASRPVLRAVSAEPDDSDLLVPAPRWPVRILHFPLRSYAQFEARVERIAVQEGQELDGRRGELHDHYRAGRLPAIYAEMVGDAAVEEGLRAGRLVHDTGLRDYLERCPDPLAAGGPPRPALAVEVSPARRDEELAGLEEDMMRALARAEHTLLGQRARARERFRRCREELDEARGRERALRDRLKS